MNKELFANLLRASEEEVQEKKSQAEAVAIYQNIYNHNKNDQDHLDNVIEYLWQMLTNRLLRRGESIDDIIFTIYTIDQTERARFGPPETVKNLKPPSL